MALTRRQKELMDFVVQFIRRQGYSPSYEEIAEGLGLASLATVHKHIQALGTKEYLRRSYNHSRSLEVGERFFKEQGSAGQAAMGNSVPLLGRIAAGAPVEAISNPEMLQFPDFAGRENIFALEVRGDSMIEDHICSGDFVLIEKISSARSGEIVVALVDGTEATLKRYYPEPNGRVRLQPANSTMAPIYMDAANLQIQGRVLGVMRKY